MTSTEGSTISEATVVVHVRLPKDLVKKVDHLSVDWDMFRNEAVARLLEESLKPYSKRVKSFLLHT